MASANSVRNYVDQLIDIFPGFLQGPARWVANRIFGVWDEVAVFLVAMRGGFGYTLDRAYRFVNAFWRFVNEAATTVRWMVSIFVPRWARWAFNLAVNTLRSELDIARRFLQGLLDTLRSWTQRAINAVDAFAHNAYRWASDRIGEIWHTLAVIRDRVVALLTSPETFVDWIFSALWRRFWRFANDHAESIAAAYWPRRDALLVKSLQRLENFLMRVL